MKYSLIPLVGVVLIAGCATNKIDPNYAAYLEAQKAQQATHKQEIQLVRLVAKDGQTISLGGVQEFTVSMPAPASAPVQQQVQQPSVWAGVIGQGLNVAGTVLGIKYAGQAAVNLSNSVGSAANHGYQFVQAPGATTNSIGGSGVIGAGSYTSTTTENLSGSGVIGSGTSSPVTTTTNPVTQIPAGRICSVDATTGAVTCQ